MNQSAQISQQRVKIQLLNRSWEFKCLPAEKDKLYEAALYLEQKMQNLRQAGKALGHEQLTLLAAISLSHELLAEKNKTKKVADLSKRLIKLRNRLNEKLTAANNAL